MRPVAGIAVEYEHSRVWRFTVRWKEPTAETQTIGRLEGDRLDIAEAERAGCRRSQPIREIHKLTLARPERHSSSATTMIDSSQSGIPARPLLRGSTLG